MYVEHTQSGSQFPDCLCTVADNGYYTMTQGKTFCKITSVPYDPGQNFSQNGFFVPYDPVPYDPGPLYFLLIVIRHPSDDLFVCFNGVILQNYFIRLVGGLKQ